MRILVTGATGGVGRLVVDELLALGATDVRALTVNPAKAGLPPRVEAVRGYLGRPETLPPALAGVDRMYLAPLVDTNAEVCRLAAAAGVRRIVDMAGAKGDHWQAIEDGVEACGVPFVHLEPGEFMANACWRSGRHWAASSPTSTCRTTSWSRSSPSPWASTAPGTPTACASWPSSRRWRCRRWPSSPAGPAPPSPRGRGTTSTCFGSRGVTETQGGNPIWLPPWARVEFPIGTGRRTNGVWGNWQPDWFWSS